MSINDTVKMMDPPRYTTSQAAALVGRSPDTLRGWRDTGRCVPSSSAQFGKLNVALYTDEDIGKMRSIVATLKPGPEPGTKYGPRKQPTE